ncbi:MAG: hypothetical protein A6F72_06790 [Cycloclasticus sp. symbiont of Poecilosclerida sp. N]|nr:MAG: hypothetical protein A6F72_06790 [Cycloclasticus sp. symbiont of Poecilosclerida sp. N]
MFHLCALYNKDITAHTDKEIREFKSIVDSIIVSGKKDKLIPVSANYTFFDHRSSEHSSVDTRMVALTPSPASTTEAITQFPIQPSQNSYRLRQTIIGKQNINAVAIWFGFGNWSALLGSDLELSTDNNKSWKSIFKSQIYKKLSLSKSSLYKVAHHGSRNGHHDDIYTQLLSENPIAIATAYTPSKLPGKRDIHRIKNHCSALTVTRDANSNTKLKLDSMVEKELKAIEKNRTVLNEKIGHIQIRITDQGIVTSGASESCVDY